MAKSLHVVNDMSKKERNFDMLDEDKLDDLVKRSKIDRSELKQLFQYNVTDEYFGIYK
ncbi:MAG: hypothetical protein IBX44_10170 [Sulfurospirillum sp.]|nr:hypothetical protein [Sulfurospirillum sp.]